MWQNCSSDLFTIDVTLSHVYGEKRYFQRNKSHFVSFRNYLPFSRTNRSTFFHRTKSSRRIYSTFFFFHNISFESKIACCLFQVLEYCAGNDLDFYLKQNKQIPEKEARSISSRYSLSSSTYSLLHPATLKILQSASLIMLKIWSL